VQVKILYPIYSMGGKLQQCSKNKMVLILRKEQNGLWQ